jgi:Cft2 family RNA processing exonuclease
MATYLKQADTHAESLLKYLEDNATDLKYAEWYDDLSVNTKMEGYLVNSARTASQYVDIDESRRIFLRMKKRIVQVEKRHIAKLICDDQYNELVAEIQADTVTPENAALIDKLRPIIAKMALYLTIPAIRVAVNDSGLYLITSHDGITGKDATRKEEIKSYMSSLKEGAFGYEADEAELRQFINDNIADYPLIEASPCYTTQADPGPSWKIDNSPENKHFSV